MISFVRCPKTARRRAITCVAFVALALLPHVVHAQDFATRSAARKLGEEGIVLFEKKQYAEALEKFNLAEQIVPAPTLGLRAARCLVQLGRFVEASERYLEVTRIKLPSNQMTPAFRKAQADAVLEREDLVPLIPTLTIVVQGPLGKNPMILVDGEEIPPAMVGQQRPIDPGVHEVEIRRKDTSVKKRVDVVVKKDEKVSLELPPLPAPPPAPVDPKLRTLAWVGLGVGAAGAITFGIAGSVAVSKERELVNDCPNRQCLPPFHAAVDTLNALRYTTTAGIVVGVIGFGVGIPLLIIRPTLNSKTEASTRTITPMLGLNAVGVRGSF